MCKRGSIHFPFYFSIMNDLHLSTIMEKYQIGGRLAAASRLADHLIENPNRAGDFVTFNDNDDQYSFVIGASRSTIHIIFMQDIIDQIESAGEDALKLAEPQMWEYPQIDGIDMTQSTANIIGVNLHLSVNRTPFYAHITVRSKEKLQEFTREDGSSFVIHYH